MHRQAPSLDFCLRQGNNNFDLLRLVASLGVIFGHGFALSPIPVGTDPIGRLLQFDYTGSLAVKLFFFLSGLLVCRSILADPRVPVFLLKRVLRIFPALFVCNVLTIVVGVALTTLAPWAFLTHPATWRYLVHNTLLFDMSTSLTLPGVLEGRPFAVNGSLWTLPKECDCYLFVACLCAFGAFLARYAAAAAFLAVMLIAVFWPAANAAFASVPGLRYLPFCFGLGALCAIFSAQIKVKVETAVMLWVLLWLVDMREVQHVLFYVAFCYSALVVATNQTVVRRLQVPYDASYGIYIYGFLIQQILFERLPRLSFPLQVASAMVVAGLLGTVSWFLVEKPAMQFGKRLVSAGRARAVPVASTVVERERGGELTPAEA